MKKTGKITDGNGITWEQFYMLLDLWRTACEVKGWSDTREARLAAWSKALGREVGSAKEMNGRDDVDRLKAELLLLARPDSLSAARATVDADEAGQRRRLLWVLGKFHPGFVGEIVYAFSRHTTHEPSELTTEMLRNVVRRCQDYSRAKKRERLERELEQIPF